MNAPVLAFVRAEPLVTVRRRLDCPLSAVYRLRDLSRIRWAGGAIAALAWCDGMLEGGVLHSCSHGPSPHRIRVFATEADNPASFCQLAAKASESEEVVAFIPEPKAREIIAGLRIAGDELGGLRAADLRREADALLTMAKALDSHGGPTVRHMLDDARGGTLYPLLLAASQLGSVRNLPNGMAA